MKLRPFLKIQSQLNLIHQSKKKSLVTTKKMT